MSHYSATKSGAWLALSPNEKWANEAKKLHPFPIYLAIIELDGGDLRLVDTQGRTESVQRRLSALAVLASPEAVAGRINPWKGIGIGSSIQLHIADMFDFFSQIVSTNTLRNRKVTIKVGFEGLDEADFLSEYVGRIKTWRRPNPHRWNVTLEDRISDLKENVPEESAGTLVNTAFWDKPRIDAIAVSSAQDSPPRIFTVTKSFASDQIKDRTILVKIGVNTHVLYQVTSITPGASFTTWDLKASSPSFDGVANGKTAELLGDNPVDIMLNIFKRVNIPNEDIITSQFINERDTRIPSLRFRRILDKPTAARELISELAEQSLITVYPSNDGKLTSKLFGSQPPHGPKVEIGQDQIIGPIKGINFWQEETEFFNRVTVWYDHDGSQEKKFNNFGRLSILANPDSQADNKETRTRQILSLWMQSGVTEEGWPLNLSTRILNRTVVPPRHVQFTTTLDVLRGQLGDMVELTHPRIPGLKTGANTLGITSELWQLISKKADIPKGRVSVELLDSRLLKRGGWIGHAGDRDYPAAGALERRHAYIGDAANNKVNAGTEEGYTIQ